MTTYSASCLATVVRTRASSLVRAGPVFVRRMSKIPGVKSMGPSSRRVKKRIVSPPGRGCASALAAPRVVFLATRAFPAHPVRVGAPLARVLNGLVHVHHDVVLGGFLNRVAVMVHHDLPPVRIAFAGQVGHVTGLDRIEPEVLVHRERAVHLALVVLDAARRLVVHDEVHALGLRIARELDDVVIGIGLREREGVAVLNPVAVPTDVPSFHEHAEMPPWEPRFVKLLLACSRSLLHRTYLT